jgi:hypothetical protein
MSLTFKTQFAAATTAFALAFAPPMAVMAQDSDQAAPQMEAGDVTDTKVAAFVDALMAVDAVRQDYVPKIEAQESEEDKQTLVNEANAAIMEAVEATDGMDVEEYTTILKLAQADESLNQKIMDRIGAVQDQ